jgi:hypothetical protein
MKPMSHPTIVCQSCGQFAATLAAAGEKSGQYTCGHCQREFEIDHPEAIAEQPYAVGKGSKHRHLLQRFFDACVSEQGKEGFLEYGFRWELENEKAKADESTEAAVPVN